MTGRRIRRLWRRCREDAHPGIHRFAERFEWFVRGVELANGYHELTDAQELLTRQKRNNQLRLAAGMPALPEHSRLMDAMLHGLPACCGVALGVDRLVMLRLGKTSIQEVMAFDSWRVGMFGKRSRRLQDSDGWDWPGFGHQGV